MGHHPSKNNHKKNNSSSQPFSSKLSRLSAINSSSSDSTRKYDLSNFAVITAIFNPANYKSRYEHYRKFAAHMSHSGVTLFTVECIFQSTARFGLPQQNFEVTNAGNRHHIQIVAPSIIWIKENLINIAVQRLPSHIEYIAWIDADLEFDRLDWPHLTIATLQRYPIVQIFELSFFLGPEGKSQVLRRDYSFGYSIRHNKIIDPTRYNEWYPHPGYAWAMRRSTFNAIGGILDFCIIGSADLHFAFALLRRMEETLRPNLHDDYKALAIQWGDRVANIADNGENVGYVNVNLWHYWHGERNDRNYVDRWSILEKHQYSPQNDLEKNDQTGLLRLADKERFGHPEMIARMEALERDIFNYFKSRNEDTTLREYPPQHLPPNRKKNFPSVKSQPNRRVTYTSTAISSNYSRGAGKPYIWSSGSAGTHIDDNDTYWDQCNCPGHHHNHGNHDCPCSSDHIDDQHCWNPSEHDDDDHHHQHQHQHHHHGHHHDTVDYSGGNNWSHDNHRHGHHHDTSDYSGGNNWSHDHHHEHSTNTNHSGFHSHDSHSGGGFSNTNYDGPGSFY